MASSAPGSKVKFIANLLIAVHALAAAEALVLGEKAGLDPAAQGLSSRDTAAVIALLRHMARQCPV